MIADKRYIFSDFEAGRQIFSAPATMGIDLLDSPYKAERQPDGDFAIRNLDIFQATQRPNPKSGRVDKFDEGWMLEAVAHFDELKRKKGYLPPVHGGHHDPKAPGEPPLIGHLDNPRVAHDAEGVATLVADVVDISPERFREIARKRWPYRSIEVNNPSGRPAVSSVAFMASTVPFHKLRPLRFSTSDLEGIGQFWEPMATDRVCFAEVDHPRQQPLVIIERWNGARYRPLTEPTRFSQRFAARDERDSRSDNDGDPERGKADRRDDQRFMGAGHGGRQHFMPDEQDREFPDEGGEPDDGFDDIEGLMDDDELAELEAMEGEDDGFGDDLDPMEMDELNSEGIDMGQLTDAMNNMADAIGQMNQKQDMVLQQVQAGQAKDLSATAGNPPPVGFSEEGNEGATVQKGKAKPAAADNGGTVTITRGQFERMQAQIEDLVQFKENAAAAFAEIDARYTLDGFDKHAERIVGDMERSDKFSDKEVRAAQKFYESEINNRMAATDDWESINVRAIFKEFAGDDLPEEGATFDDKGIPPKSRGDEGNPPAKDGNALEDRIARFCEEQEDCAQFFAEGDPDRQKSIDAFQQAEKHFASMDASKQREYGSASNFIANVISRQVGAAG